MVININQTLHICSICNCRVIDCVAHDDGNNNWVIRDGSYFHRHDGVVFKADSFILINKE